MAADNGNTASETWPMPEFRFEVDLGPELKSVTFWEISGLDQENQIEYRKANNPLFAIEKMPGIVKYGNVTLKKGVFVNDNTFWNWHQQIKMNTIERRTVMIRLLDEAGNVMMQWQLNNAWPTKITSTDQKPGSGQVFIDTIEIAHEQLIITNSK